MLKWARGIYQNELRGGGVSGACPRESRALRPHFCETHSQSPQKPVCLGWPHGTSVKMEDSDQHPSHVDYDLYCSDRDRHFTIEATKRSKCHLQDIFLVALFCSNVFDSGSRMLSSQIELGVPPLLSF